MDSVSILGIPYLGFTFSHVSRLLVITHFCLVRTDVNFSFDFLDTLLTSSATTLYTVSTTVYQNHRVGILL